MPDYNPDEIDRLVREGREDDERMTPGPWDWRFCDLVQLTDAGKGYPFDLYPDSQTVATGRCEACGETRGIVKEADALAIARTRNNLRAVTDQLEAATEEVERLTKALTKISAIRDSIVGCQGFNFSEHAYPLVAALNKAGFKGAGYEIASKNLGTLIERATKAEAENTRLSARVRELESQQPACGERSPVPWFTACVRKYPHDGQHEHRPLQSLYDKQRCEACGSDSKVWDGLIARVRELELTEEEREALRWLRSLVEEGDCGLAGKLAVAVATLDRLVKGGR